MTLPHQDRPAFLSPFPLVSPWFSPTPFLLGEAPVQDRAYFCTYLKFEEIADAREPRFFILLSLSSKRDGIMSQLLIVHKPPVFSLSHFKERSSGETLFFGLGVWALAFQSSLSPFALLSASQPS